MGAWDAIKSAFTAAAPMPDVQLKQKGDDYVEPIGGAGTINYEGYLQPDEYNQKLRWPQSIDVYERMRRSDPAVREALSVLRRLHREGFSAEAFERVHGPFVARLRTALHGNALWSSALAHVQASPPMLLLPMIHSTID